MAINEDTVKHVAKLAKLKFEEDEIHDFTKEMDDIIEMVEKLENLNTEGVEGTYHGNENSSVLRKDEAEKGMDRNELFQNVKSEKDGFIEVPAILDNGESGA
jgi:aspartyl-tRNA(Asn)/glutamyl-tRNA(Gln) amidotransferase subunit C